jgi:outer membrane protein assembly factor BamB
VSRSRRALLVAGAALALAACGGPAEPGVPLAAGSPWPKFRANARQDGRSDVRPTLAGGALWSFPTGKGIFSSPVVGADGTVYVGSADRTFYALWPDGSVRWQKLTGEIIDSSGLLDDQGRVYFGSGDGHLYARDAATGAEVWTFAADPPAVGGGLINWFEGNVAIGPDGTLYAPNDNFLVYAVDRATGQAVWRLQMPDQTWSLPAVDARTGDLFVGSNTMVSALGSNVFGVGPDGVVAWEQRHNGTVAASPLLTRAGLVIVGGFDGFVRAYGRDGVLRWEVGTRDHVYASPAQLSGGTVVQPSADGTIYALDPDTGALVWAHDTLEAVRSSPAVDGDDNIYVGTGDGRLLVLNPDGTRRWAMQLVADERNDLNASPALGRDAVYLAGESGEVFSVPYDYCLRPEGAADARCVTDPGEDLPAEGAEVRYTTQLGAPLAAPPAAIDANQTLAFSLFVRQGGDTVLALLDSVSVTVSVTPAAAVDVEVSGDRRFFTVAPRGHLQPDADGGVTVRVTGQYLVDLDRDGLSFTGGVPGGTFDRSFRFALRPAPASPYALAVPQQIGDPAAALELYRIAAPLPTILPSYNQIGFDSLHYLLGAVEGTGERFIVWVAGAKLAEDENRTVIDPATRALFALEVEYRDGLLTMVNEAGFGVEAMNARITFNQFRVTARLEPDGQVVEAPRLAVSTRCRSITLYGPFLQMLGLCNSQTDVLAVFGAALLRPHAGGTQAAPDWTGAADFTVADGQVTATLTGAPLVADEHSVAILLVDQATGRPVSLDYGLVTTRAVAADGALTGVALAYRADEVPTEVRAYLMVDTYPAARVASLTLK